jgi:hypothetical protein
MNVNPNNFKELVDYFAARLQAKFNERPKSIEMVPHPLKPGTKVCQWYFNEISMLVEEINAFRQSLGRRLATFQQVEDLVALAMGRRNYGDRLALCAADMVQQ